MIASMVEVRMVETPTCSVTTRPTASIRATAVAEARRGLRAALLAASLTVGPANPKIRPKSRSRRGI